MLSRQGLSFAANGKALAEGERDGFVKIVADREYGEVLGVHIVGPDATDLIAEAANALQLEATLSDLAQTIHPHPTLSRGADGGGTCRPGHAHSRREALIPGFYANTPAPTRERVFGQRRLAKHTLQELFWADPQEVLGEIHFL